MSDAVPAGTEGSSATERAEAMMERLGQRLSAARQRAAQAAENGAAQAATPPGAAQAASAPAMERADEIVTRVSERVGGWWAAASLQVRRAGALAREEAEDMWAEAQMIRQQTPAQPAPEAPPNNSQ